MIRNRNQFGFTLIEALVATAVFSLISGAAVGVYLSTYQLDKKTRAERTVNQNARYIMAYLSKEIWNGKINYASYPGSPGTVPGSNPTLWVQNQALEVEQFSYSSPNMVLTKNSASTNLNSSGVKVTKLNFLITPNQDPYTSSKLTNVQPHVTVVLELTSNYGSKPSENVTLNYQNTFSTRMYPSRQ